MRLITVLKVMGILGAVAVFIASFSGIGWLLSQGSNVWLAVGVAWAILDVGILLYAGGWVWQRKLHPFLRKMEGEGGREEGS